MPKQTVNPGSNPNDGTGDALRDAFIKINDNTDELYAHKESTTNPHGVTSVQVGAVPNSRIIVAANSLSGGGDLSADRTLELANDVAAPGADQVYGTDGTGVRGWKADPAGGGSGAGLTGPIESLALPATSVLDWNTSVFKVITISGDTVATFANLPAAGTHDEMHLRIVQDATGSWEVTWPAEAQWPQGEPPNMADMEPNEELFVSFQIDDGAVVTGSHNLLPRINYQTGITYTIAPTDDGKEVRLSNLNPITLTVETEATMGFIPNGYAVGFTWWGPGSVTVVAGTGVTIERRADLTAVLHSQYASGLLRYYGSEHWLLSGELAAV